MYSMGTNLLWINCKWYDMSTNKQPQTPETPVHENEGLESKKWWWRLHTGKNNMEPTSHEGLQEDVPFKNLVFFKFHVNMLICQGVGRVLFISGWQHFQVPFAGTVFEGGPVVALGGSVLFEIAVSIETICLVLRDATLNAPTVNGSFTHLERTHTYLVRKW